MSQKNLQSEEEPFSYEILDQEAAKISSLMLSVQMKCLQPDQRAVAQELFNWAEQLFSEGRRSEAEFLYLNAINRMQQCGALTYPVKFTGLREFAQLIVSGEVGQSPEKSRTAIVTTLEPKTGGLASIEATAA